ncbi:MAG: MerR family transcriptional regulator [Bacteroidetes bacterium]|nr:MerR family transcriptional regulator [Bacteroidota bacterium]
MENTEKQNIDKPIYSIGSAARVLNISVHTIRKYEKAGLIIPRRFAGKNRLYSELDIERLRCIRKEISNKKYSIPAIQVILSHNPCWAVINCSDEERNKCPAYQNGDKPCWTYKHSANKCAELECYSCTVYRDFQCNKIKDNIVKYTKK